jgi:hypothetical protein
MATTVGAVWNNTTQRYEDANDTGETLAPAQRPELIISADNFRLVRIGELITLEQSDGADAMGELQWSMLHVEAGSPFASVLASYAKSLTEGEQMARENDRLADRLITCKNDNSAMGEALTGIYESVDSVQQCISRTATR